MDKPTVLVVDDDRNLCDAIGRVAEQSGCAVICASSFRQVIQSTRTHRIDIAICDWDLNDQDSGVDIGRELQKKNPELLLVFITGNSVRELHKITGDLNVHCIVEKPVDLKTLRSLITDLTGIYSRDG